LGQPVNTQTDHAKSWRGIVTLLPILPSDQAPEEAIELSIVMPCLNEVRTVGICIDKALRFMHEKSVAGEVVVADNGSTDGSQEIAARLGARVVPVAERGYGQALRAGIAACRGRFVVMGDSDDSYDFLSLLPFLDKLRDGYDIVLGNRFAGGISPGAMPLLHRVFGNPLLTLIGRTLYGGPSHDFYCGMRGFRRDRVLDLNLDSPGMEFALEMIVKATIAKLRIIEVPTTLSPDGRNRPPHLRSWRDGWRSLRFFLLLSPRALFLYPGLAVLGFGLVCFFGLIGGNVHVGRIGFAERTFIVGCSAIIIGVQAVSFWVFAKMAAIDRGLLPTDPRFKRLRKLATVEIGASIGGTLVALGLIGNIFGLAYWASLSFGNIEPGALIRIVTTASTALVLGFQILHSSFFIYLLDYVGKKPQYRRFSEEAEKLIQVPP
jgi:glycosyltransferase involved in cell wall biosynthesis